MKYIVGAGLVLLFIVCLFFVDWFDKHERAYDIFGFVMIGVTVVGIVTFIILVCTGVIP